MTPNLLEQFRDFEIFAEKMEAIVEEIKRSHLTDDEGNIYELKDFDLRDDVIGSVDSIPTTIKDYAYIWEYVQNRYKEYLVDCDNPLMPNEMYFDVYWNNMEGNAAFYDNLTLWIFFDYEYGIFYEDDFDIIEKISQREKSLAQNL